MIPDPSLWAKPTARGKKSKVINLENSKEDKAFALSPFFPKEPLKDKDVLDQIIMLHNQINSLSHTGV